MYVNNNAQRSADKEALAKMGDISATWRCSRLSVLETDLHGINVSFVSKEMEPLMRTVIVTAGFSLALITRALAVDLTPAQTEGPYYPRTKPAETDNDLTRIGSGPVARGVALTLRGKVLDPQGKPIMNARVEIWQTDEKGIYLHPDDSRTGQRDKTFQFYGEVVSAADGAFSFRTIMPAAYPGRPRHIHAKITPPGGKTLTTQFYFKADDLSRDGIARRLGKALDQVLLDPQPVDGVLASTVTIVVPGGVP